MNEEQARAAISLIEEAGAKIDERIWGTAEKHADVTDRHISQIAQLKIINEADPINDLVAALAGAESADPT